MSTTSDVEIGRLQRLLKQLAKIAEHTSLTGTFGGGAVDAVEKYNLIVTRLNAKGLDLGDLFPLLPSDASMDRVGLSAKLLSAFIADEDADRPGISPSIHIGQLGNLGELENLKDLGNLIKENMPEWFRPGMSPDIHIGQLGSLSGLERPKDSDNVAKEDTQSSVQTPSGKTESRETETMKKPDTSETETMKKSEDAIPMPNLSRTKTPAA
jgi:hypothetical protein